MVVDLYLADARAEVEARPVGDSLRALVYQTHGLDSTRLRTRLDAVADEPGGAVALAEAVEARLSAERSGDASPPP